MGGDEPVCGCWPFFLVSGAALESGMQHFVLKQKIMLHLVDFTVFFSLQIKLVGGLGGLVHGWW